MDLKARNVLVVGLALSGRAAAEFLVQRGARVTVNDIRPDAAAPAEIKALEQIGADIVLGAHPERLFLDSDLIVVSPGVPLGIHSLQSARDAGIEIIGEIELAGCFLQGRVVGVTGSNGKTTTTTLIGELLGAGGIPTAVGGNIGTPLISLAATSRADGVTVVELSSFQLETIRRFRCHVAVLTNVTPDHLDRHESFEQYVLAKQRIFENQTAGDLAVLNADDAVVRQMRDSVRARVMWFSRRQQMEEGIFLRGSTIVLRHSNRERELIDRSDIRLLGDHNLENVMAAIATALDFGVSPDSMRATVGNFLGVEHRLEPVTTIQGVRFFNDSKATNVDAADKAIRSFPGGLFLILGGKDKDGDFTVLARLIRERVKHILLVGAATEKIARQLAGVRPITRCDTLRAAVREGFERATAGDVVLLAPACASFDMFENYGHRGRVFKQEVMNLAAERGAGAHALAESESR